MIARLSIFSLSRLRERMPKSARHQTSLNLGMVRGFRRIGLALGGIAGGLILLDLIGLVATIYFREEILAQAEAAGLADLMPR
jgi:hypothetical protein